MAMTEPPAGKAARIAGRSTPVAKTSTGDAAVRAEARRLRKLESTCEASTSMTTKSTTEASFIAADKPSTLVAEARTV